MYIDIQERINKIMVMIFLLTCLLLVSIFYIFFNQGYDKIYLVVIFFIIFMIMNACIRLIEKNLEHHTMYKMIRKRYIALAKINHVRFYKESRETNFSKKFIYEFDIEIITQDKKIIKTKIYENVCDSQFECLPGYVYVTYNNQNQWIGIIPNLLLSMMSEVEPIVREYEKNENPHYILAIKKNGLSLKQIE